jgi:hypothetical protein
MIDPTIDKRTKDLVDASSALLTFIEKTVGMTGGEGGLHCDRLYNVLRQFRAQLPESEKAS